MKTIELIDGNKINEVSNFEVEGFDIIWTSKFDDSLELSNCYVNDRIICKNW